MSYTEAIGRFGNQVIRNIAVSLIAEKYNLKVSYVNQEMFNVLGIDLFSGQNVYNQFILLEDDNYFNIYNCENVTYNLYSSKHYFQTKDITNFVFNHLHKDKVKQKIIERNPYKKRYNNNNDLFIHIRLTDAVQFNPGVDYYLNAIKDIHHDNIYIATDDTNHEIISKIMSIYPKVTILVFDEINTFQFGSTAKHILLSHGSFSAVIGYLAYYSTIYYPEYTFIKSLWFGYMFSINNWVELKYIGSNKVSTI